MTRSTCSAILLLGGNGARFENDLPKQFHLLQDKKLYLWTLHTFIKSRLFHEIILVIPKNFLQEVTNDLKKLSSDIPIRITTGGSSRQESSFLGVNATSDNIAHVCVHDGVRPFVSIGILKMHIEALKIYKAIDTCVPATDTIVHSKNHKCIDEIPNRCELFLGQTPQSFCKKTLLQAHSKAKDLGINDLSCDCKLSMLIGEKPYIVQGSYQNIKITTSTDMMTANAIIKKGI